MFALDAKSCRMVLVRHAHTEMASRFCGSMDPPLSEKGRQQLPGLLETLAKYPLSHVFSSDLLRSSETANAIAERSRLTVEYFPSLREVRFGEWEGFNWDEVSQRDPTYAQRWMEQYPRLPAPGGETFTCFRERVRNTLVGLAVRTSNGCAAVVTHGGVIRTLMLEALNLPESNLGGIACDYASCTEFYWSGKCWNLKS